MRTHSPHCTRRIIALSACLVLVAPVARAQGAQRVPITSGASARDHARADELERRVQPLLQLKSKWGEAARLQQRAAMLRGDDPRAVMSLRHAAFYNEAVGHHTIARTLMERAAACAEENGEVALAAESLIDAAFLAVEERRSDLVPDFVRRARRLTASSHLRPDVRDALLARLGDAPTTQGVAVAKP